MKKKFLDFAQSPVILFLAVGTLVKGIAYAAVPVTPGSASTLQDLGGGFFCPIIDIMFWGLLVVSVIMVLYAAYIYVTAADDAAKPSQARKMILYAAIGIVIALIAKGAPNIVANVFSLDVSSSPFACP